MSDAPDFSAALIKKAWEALSAARADADHDHADAAVNRAYYAAFHAARAALATAGEAPRSHRGVQHRFHERFVREGPFDPALARVLRAAAAALDLIADVERFVAAVDDALPAQP